MSLNKRAFFLIPLLVFIVYANTMGNGFVWDDNNLILENPILRDIREMPSVFTKDLHYFTYEKSGFYRPLQTISFVFDHAIWKQNPFGYHFTNILIHAANALLVYFLINLLFNNILVSFLTGLLFAVHPIQTQAVTYISGRADLLAAFFILLGLICYIKQRHLAMTAACFILALMSKEISLVFPFLIMGTGLSLRGAKGDEAIPLRGGFALSRGLLRHFVPRNDVVKIVPIFLIAAIYVILRFTALNFFEIQKGVLMYGTSWPERFFTFFKVLPTYLRLLVIPTGLHMAWDVPLAKTFFDYKVIFGAFLIITAGVLAIRSKDNLYKFAAGWFAICLLPSSNLLTPLNAVMAEHWLYLPSIGVFLVAAQGVVALSLRATGGSEAIPLRGGFALSKGLLRHFVPRNDVVVYFLFALLVLSYSAATFQRNKAWKNDIAIYSDTIKHSPDVALVHYNLSNALRKAGRMDEALEESKAAIRIEPKFGRALNNMGSIYVAKGMYQEAKEFYKKAIAVIPNEEEPYSNLGYLYNSLGRYDEAIAELNKVLAMNPNFSPALNNLGNSYLGKGDKAKAIELWKRAVTIDPHNKSAKENLRRFGETVIANP